MTTLLDVITTLPADMVGRVSRIRIEPAPGRCRINIHYLGGRQRAPLGIHDDGPARPIPRGPVSAGDTQGVSDRNPPVTMMVWEAYDDTETSIVADDIAGQIEDLRLSGIVGGLNVERVGRNTVISTHAATQAERNAWLRTFAGATP